MTARTHTLNLPVHWACNLFPTMPSEEFDALLESMRKTGQLDEIVTWQGQVVDGRHRLEACERLGIEPRIKMLPDDMPEDKIVDVALSKNTRRRMLTTSQAAAVAYDLYRSSANLHTKLSITEAAEMLKVSPSLVNQLVAMVKAEPGLYEEVRDGRLTVNASNTLAKTIPGLPPEQREAVLTAVKEARSPKEAKGAVRKAVAATRGEKTRTATPGRGRELEFPKLTGEYSTLLAVLRGVHDLADALARLPQLTLDQPLGSSHARQMLRAVRTLEKLDVEALRQAAKTAEALLLKIAKTEDEAEVAAEGEAEAVDA